MNPWPRTRASAACTRSSCCGWLSTSGLSRAAFARHNGTAPLPVWSGNTIRHRLSRSGNRQLNAALHRIAITQLQHDGPGKTYVEHRRSQGNTKAEAIRALRRRISDEVFRRMRHDEAARAASPSGLAAAAATVARRHRLRPPAAQG